MDIVDHANDIAAMHLETAISGARAAVSPKGPGREYCRDCGELIPPGRRLAVSGCELCVGCQAEAEKMTGCGST
jgi:phage/conjugal plasmid C-4 type zinc finger TraR family protein